ncbi:MAG: NAD(P)H-binding protein [bacterium]|nr:NAD(P)H-binding protein [bacterium]
MSTAKPPALVTGATGYTGRRLVHRLVHSGHSVRVLVRPDSHVESLPEGIEILRGDLDDPATLRPALEGVSRIYHLAHVRFTGNLMPHVPADVAHVVIVSSLRALSRVASPTVAQVLSGETAVAGARVPWTILRPSMIFGDGDDRNISRLVSRVRQGNWIPTMGRHCLHQPVYVGDVVEAILACVEAPAARGQTYAIAGAMPLTWDALIHAVGDVVGQRPRQWPVPAAVAARFLSALEATGLRLPIEAEQVWRMLEDKVYDIEPARRDLHFAPLTFAAAMRQIYGDPEEIRA